nr:MAG TPA: hypothetical protein [Bacteriophage sp.]DAL67118.1 MAG TPA: hypothetical protein [Bacteriophage sp.]
MTPRGRVGGEIKKKESSLNNRIGSLIIFHATHDGKILISLSAVHFFARL